MDNLDIFKQVNQWHFRHARKSKNVRIKLFLFFQDNIYVHIIEDILREHLIYLLSLVQILMMLGKEHYSF